MSYESEKMTIEVMERMINCAYNDVTFKNALVCTLDWCNWYRCTHIHKDTKIGVDADGVRIEKYKQVKLDDKYQLTTDTTVDITKEYFEKSGGKYYKVLPPSGTNPQAEGYYEYVNPSDYEHNWYEKIKTEIEYAEVAKTDISYYDSPQNNKWYERVEDVYYPSTDVHCVGTYIELVSPETGASPRDNDWYEKTGSAVPDVPENYSPSMDNNVNASKTYYMCSYKKYYKQISNKVNKYVKTSDTVVIAGKTYYVEKNVDHYVPTDESGWDYSDHYVRNIDITVNGVDEEITLQNKRPIVLEG